MKKDVYQIVSATMISSLVQEEMRPLQQFAPLFVGMITYIPLKFVMINSLVAIKIALDLKLGLHVPKRM